MHTNLFFLQRISYNIMRDQYIDFMCIRIKMLHRNMDAYVNVNRLFMHIRMKMHSIKKVILGIYLQYYYFPLSAYICERNIRSLSGKNSWV